MHMKQMPSISDAEWQIMKVLWAQSPLSANEIVEKLEGSCSWKPKTIKTLIGRLVAKKALSYNNDNRTYFYYPIVEEQDCVLSESESFVKKVFNGSVNVMIANFLENKQLSKKEIAELKKILDEKDV